MATATTERSNGHVPRSVSIELPAPEVTTFKMTLVGTSALITNNFSAAQKAKIARGQDGSAKQKKAPRDPEADFLDSAYYRDDGGYGIPKLAFRKAFQSSAMRMTEVKGTIILAAFQIATPDELLPLVAGKPKMRTDHVVHGMTADLAYRAEFWPWSVTMPITLDHEVVSLDQFVHVVYKAGMGVGVGNWRPEKKGDFGCWTISSIDDVVVTGKAAR